MSCCDNINSVFMLKQLTKEHQLNLDRDIPNKEEDAASRSVPPQISPTIYRLRNIKITIWRIDNEACKRWCKISSSASSLHLRPRYFSSFVGYWAENLPEKVGLPLTTVSAIFGCLLPTRIGLPGGGAAARISAKNLISRSRLWRSWYCPSCPKIVPAPLHYALHKRNLTAVICLLSINRTTKFLCASVLNLLTEHISLNNFLLELSNFLLVWSSDVASSLNYNTKTTYFSRPRPVRPRPSPVRPRPRLFRTNESVQNNISINWN